MLSAFRRRNHQRSPRITRINEIHSQPRYWYDLTILAVEVAAVLGLAATIYFTLQTAKESRAEIEQALSSMEAMTNAMQTQQEAMSSQAEASKKLAELTVELASSASKQAEAAQLQARASQANADILAEQVSINRDQLLLSQATNVDVVLRIIGSERGTSVVTANLFNTGNYPDEDAELCVKQEFTVGPSFENAFLDMAGCQKIRLNPNVPQQKKMVNPPVTLDWPRLVAQNRWITYSFRLRFSDAAGRKIEIRRCVAFQGDRHERESVRYCSVQ